MNPASNARAQRTGTLRSLLGLLCIALVLFAGGVELLHNHATPTASDPACSLCTLSHVVALPGAVAHAPAAVEAVAFAPLRAIALAPARAFAFSLYVRPPPAENPRAL